MTGKSSIDGISNGHTADAVGAEDSLSTAFRRRTHTLHGRAERSGIINQMLRGKITRRDYALFLRNLLPAYVHMEKGLKERGMQPAFREIADPAVYRAQCIERDLRALCGAGWADTLPLMPAGARYAQRIADIAAGDGTRLIAHAYARYLGDLNGGQILKRLLMRALGLGDDALSFYEFADIADLDGFKIAYRDALDRSGRAIANIGAVIEESAEAFALNIQVSEAVLQASVRPD